MKPKNLVLSKGCITTVKDLESRGVLSIRPLSTCSEEGLTLKM